MCSEVKNDAGVKWLLVALATINAAGLAIYLLIHIVTSANDLSAKRIEPHLTVNLSPSTAGDAGAHAKISSDFKSPETTVSYRYKTKVTLGDYELEFTLRDLKLGEVHTRVKVQSNIAHTCGYSLLDKDGLENVTRTLLENGCISYPRESDFIFRGMF